MTHVQHSVFGQCTPEPAELQRAFRGAAVERTEYSAVPPARPDVVACPGGQRAASQSEPPAFGIFQSLVDDLNSAVQSLSAWLGRLVNEENAEGAPSQNVRRATFSSVGDPHLAETGQLHDSGAGMREIDNHFDSMRAHENLISSQDFDGGYRVSTTVTPPDASGVTMNQSATVHTNAARNTVTLNGNGTFAVSEDGSSVDLQPGASVTLAGGEVVTRGTDGALSIAQTNAGGGSISTTLRGNGGGVDVLTTVQNARVGGDIAAGSA